jgi:Ala-tRNA(Pro) deacylase
MPAGRTELLAMLDRLGIAVATVEHPPLFTVDQSRALRGEIPGGHTKNLFLKDKRNAVFLVIAEEDAALDLKTLHQRIGSARLSFARAELLAELFGVTPGSVTPFGAINDTALRVTIIFDSRLLRHDVLNFHPLSNDATTSIARDDLLRFLRATGHEPRVVDLAARGGSATIKAAAGSASSGLPTANEGNDP